VLCSLRLYAAEHDIAQEKPLFKRAMKVTQNFHILLKQRAEKFFSRPHYQTSTLGRWTGRRTAQLDLQRGTRIM